MTDAQLQALRAALLADTDPAVVAAVQARNDTEVARLYNEAAVPSYWCWRTSVRKNEYTQQTSADGTTFSWVGAGFITRSVGERDAWRELFNGGGNGDGTTNPSLANVRQAFSDIFSGATAPAPANRAHLLAMSRRLATRAEQVFATGAGTSAAPSQFGSFQGSVTIDDIGRALNG